MRPVVWTPKAVRDVNRIHDYIEQFNPPAAARIAAELFGSTDLLKHFPELGRPAEDDTRERLILNRYVVVYETDQARTRILRVWNAAQDRPGSRPPVFSQ